MDKKYTGTIRWLYGKRKYVNNVGDSLVTGFYDEEIDIIAMSDDHAYYIAMETARDKLNESKLRGRPVTNSVEIKLTELRHSKGEVDLSERITLHRKRVFD
ncbi:MAG TPA: hypothetical protein P5277_04820 [Candidatus Paceibacterota bacterium]|nr:hypothetical protein [Candidatus Paceibacterota bacterium]